MGEFEQNAWKQGTFRWARTGENKKKGGHLNWREAHICKGDYYTGAWKYDLKTKTNFQNGEGTYYYKDGRQYSGNWKEGVKEGFGRYSWPDGNLYEVISEPNFSRAFPIRSPISLFSGNVQ